MTDENEEKNDNNFYNEKELLKRCKNINRKNKNSKYNKYNYSKKHVQNSKEEAITRNCFSSLLKKLKSKLKYFSIFTSFIIIFFVIMNTVVFYMQSCFILPLERINFQITNFSEINTIVYVLDFIHLGNSHIAYLLRNNLLNQYKHIYKTNNHDSYYVAGIFREIYQEFVLLNLYPKNDSLYLKYKEEYLSELEKILFEYPTRNMYSEKYMEFNSQPRGTKTFFIPNRITFYLVLANEYFDNFKSNLLENNISNLNKLKSILNGYDIIYQQEKSKNSSHYQSKNASLSGIRYEKNYNLFIYYYSKNIILMEEKLNPDNFCKNNDIFSKYLSVVNISHYNNEDDKQIFLLLKNKCNIDSR